MALWTGLRTVGAEREGLVIPGQEVLGMMEGEGKGATFSTRHSQCFLCVLEVSLTETLLRHAEGEAPFSLREHLIKAQDAHLTPLLPPS